MKNLIVFALEKEAPGIFKDYADVYAIGVGKVNAAINTMRLINLYKPDRVINFGTAGGIKVGSGIYRINQVLQHDVNLMALGLAPGCQLGEVAAEINLSGEGKICASGDLFVTEPAKLRTPCDIIEMEAYSIAKACEISQVQVEIWKYITDQADENSAKDWQSQVQTGENYYRQVLESLGVEAKT